MEYRPNAMQGHPDARPTALGKFRAEGDEQRFNILPGNATARRILKDRLESLSMPLSHLNMVSGNDTNFNLEKLLRRVLLCSGR